MLRYEIEQKLIEGMIEPEQIPELWATRMQEYLGLEHPGDYRNGCLQDIHWTDGSFGYFPSYTLGAMYAAQFAAPAAGAGDFTTLLGSARGWPRSLAGCNATSGARPAVWAPMPWSRPLPVNP